MEMRKELNEWAIPVCFLVIPYAIIANGLIWKSHAIFFILMALPILALSIKNLWVRSILIWTFIWSIFIFITSLLDKRVNPGPCVSVVLVMIVGAYLYKRISESKLPDETWYKFIRIAIIAQLAIAFSQFLGFNPVTWAMQSVIRAREAMPGTFVGTIGNRNFLMAMVAISIPMFMTHSIKWTIDKPFGMKGVHPWHIKINLYLIIMLIALFLSPAPAVIAAAIGIGIYFKERRKALVFGLIAALGYGYYYIVVNGAHFNEFTNLPDQIRELWNTGRVTFEYQGARYYPEALPRQYDLGRFGMWLVAIAKIFHDPFVFIFGHGPGAFWGKGYNMHSEYFTMWFQFGTVGLVIMLGYIYKTVRFIYTRDRVLLTAFCIACLDMTADYPMHIATVAFLVIIVAGLIERRRLNDV